MGTQLNNSYNFLQPTTDKFLLSVYIILALAYFILVAFVMPRGNMGLFYLLVAGEVFHLWQALTYAHTVWHISSPVPYPLTLEPSVDIFITVVNEPLSIVETTARAAKNLDYGNHTVYILNDGRVAGNLGWRDYELLARKLGVKCITRKVPGGGESREH